MRYAVATLAIEALLVTIPCWSLAQPDIIAKFLPRSHTFQGTTLVYRLLIPEGYTSSKRYPIVLALHGNSFQGSDNLIHIQFTRLATSWADSVNQAKYPCFVVAPQCRAGYDWIEGPALSPDLATANNILDSLAREFSIDTTRMYVTGLSMGGFATWRLVSEFPDRFAAAVPVSAGWWGSLAFRIGDVPIWSFMGAQDAIVPVESVRDIIKHLHRRGRPVVYTHCQNGDCTGLSSTVIASYVEKHADLFYTETPDGQHDIAFFNFAFDYPFLRPWLFDKIRQTRGLVTLTNTNAYRVLRGMVPLTWTATHLSDSVQIRFSSDGGFSWQVVASSLPNTGSYLWNTESVGDCAFGLVKIFLKNLQGQIYGYDQSAYVAIDNGAAGKPIAKILNPDAFLQTVIDTNTVALQYLASSSKPGPVTVRFYYSADGGLSFTEFDSYAAERDTTSRIRTLNLASLPNSETAVLRIDASNGTSVSSDTTTPLHPFIKRTPRTSGATPTLVTGIGNGTVNVLVVDAAKLTGDEYRVSFHNTPALGKAYNVQDATKGITVVQNATQLDGVTEGPLFDGMRLVIRDYPRVQVNQDSTGWKKGVSTLLQVQAAVAEITIEGQTITGYPYPADYQISFSGPIVDTSSDALFGTGRIPVNFSVWNMTEKRKSEFVFIDSDKNRQISNFDEILILEPDSQGAPRLTWDLFFAGVPPATTVPGPGDQFVLRTLKPFQPGDTFAFRGIETSVSTGSLPESPRLSQNYPNPFNPATVVRFELPFASNVKLLVYDILGREVARLVDGRTEPGTHQVMFNAAGLSSGVYFCRLTAGTYVETKRMLLVK